LPNTNRYLALLIVINLFNYIDRQVLSAVLPRMQLDGTLFPPGDPNSQFKAGLLTSAFMASYMLLSPLFGWMDGHRYRRWVILGIGVTLWSIASGCSGLATGYWILLLTRCCVGVGEGAYGPVASAMIADLYPESKRGKVMALFNMAIPIGSAIGFLVGAQIAEAFDSWRPAFTVTFSGVILGLICFLQREPARPPSTSGVGPSYWHVLQTLATCRSFVLCCAGMTAITFVIGGVAAWAPAYLYQREAKFQVTVTSLESLSQKLPVTVVEKLRPLQDDSIRTYVELRKSLGELLTTEEGANHAEVIYQTLATSDSPKSSTLTTLFGAMIVVGGFAATAVGAFLADWLKPRMRGAYFLVIGVGALAAVPFYLGLLFAPMPWVWVCIFFAVFGLFLHTGPAFTILANVTRSDDRATAFAINILVIHLLGDAISPTLIGWVADLASLQLAFLLMTTMIVIGGVLWLLGMPHLERDTAAASQG
jgi:MFS transporter, Spinster family, sphingosine-1-phosphate transporter